MTVYWFIVRQLMVEGKLIWRVYILVWLEILLVSSRKCFYLQIFCCTGIILWFITFSMELHTLSSKDAVRTNILCMRCEFVVATMLWLAVFIHVDFTVCQSKMILFGSTWRQHILELLYQCSFWLKESNMLNYGLGWG